MPPVADMFPNQVIVVPTLSTLGTVLRVALLSYIAKLGLLMILRFTPIQLFLLAVRLEEMQDSGRNAGCRAT